MRNLVVHLLLIALLSPGCNSAAVPTGRVESTPEPTEDSLVAQTTRVILSNFRDSSYEVIATHIHPDKGVRFSPYCYIDTAEDVRFTPEQFRDALKRPSKIHWGHFDGSGDPIDLTFGEYVERFVYDADFLHAEETLINRSKGFGNTIDNREQVYGNKPFVCCYFSGIDPQYEGMDWRSLHLVYEIEDGKAWLIGIIHSEWTI